MAANVGLFGKTNKQDSYPIKIVSYLGKGTCCSKKNMVIKKCCRNKNSVTYIMNHTVQIFYFVQKFHVIPTIT